MDRNVCFLCIVWSLFISHSLSLIFIVTLIMSIGANEEYIHTTIEGDKNKRKSLCSREINYKERKKSLLSN